MGRIDPFFTLVFIIPYSFLGIDFANQLLFVAGLVYILVCYKKIVPDMIFTVMTSVIAVSFCISLFFTSDLLSSFNGLAHYLNIPVYYLIFKSLRSNKEKVFNSFYYVTIVVVTLSILIESIVLNRRMQGNLTYSNSFALMILTALFISNYIPRKFLAKSGNILLILGIFYTGSRTTLFLLGIYYIIKSVFKIRDERYFWDIFDLSASIIIYISLQYRNFIIVPVLIIIISLRFYMKKKKLDIAWLKTPVWYKVSLMVICIMACSISMILSRTFMGSRLGLVGINTGVLQERFVIFQDVIGHILRYPLGSGINSFEYMQYSEQSAFYDVRFVHNSILQISYDLGLIPAFMAMVLFVLGIVRLIKSGVEDRYFISAFLALFILHSLLDFDFSFSTAVFIFIILNMYWKHETRIAIFNWKNNYLWLVRACLVFGIYIAISSLTLCIANGLASKGEYEKAISFAEFNNSITIDNSNVCLLLAQYYRQKAEFYTNDENSERNLDVCLNYLIKAEKLNPRDVRIKINMAFILSEMGDFEKADEYYKLSVMMERFNSELYDAYYKFLVAEKPEKVKWLEDYKKSNLTMLNPKAVYMQDQLIHSRN